MRNYYALLGLNPNATQKEIKKNFRLLATKYHPDKSDDPDSAEKFIAISEAYDILNNKKTRTQYDLFRWEKLKRDKAAKESFIVVQPPIENSNTRRLKAQRKRGLNFQQQKSQTKRAALLGKECLLITSKYYLHVLGLTLLIVIMNSMIGKLSDTFTRGILHGAYITLIVSGLTYGIVLICRNAFINFKRDIKSLSIFFKLYQKNAILLLLLLFTFTILSYLAFLAKAFN